MRHRALALLLSTSIAATSLTTLPALAQMDADTKEAKALFEDGVKLYKAGDFEKARVKFKAAYGLKKRPSILLNLARAELQTKHPVEAAAHFHELMTLADAKPEDKDDAKAGIAECRKQLGVVMVEAPAGSTVTVDGAVTTVPPEGIEVVPGAHSVVIKTPSGATTAEKVTLFGGQTSTVKSKGEGAATAPTTPPTATTTAPTTPPPADTTPPPATTTPPPADTTTPPPPPGDTPPPAETPKRGFFASIHPVTYVAAGITVVSIPLAIVFAVNGKTHDDNAGVYAGWLTAHPANKFPDAACPGSTRPGCSPTYATFRSQYRASGQDELNQSNTEYTLANVFTGVAIAGAAATVVTFILMRKKDEAPKTGFTAAPLVGGGGYFGFYGAF